MEVKMEKNKALMAFVVLVLLALIGFNFDAITGKVTTGKNLVPSVTAVPIEIKAGDMIDIKIKPRDGCVDPEVGFYFSGKNIDGTITSSGGRKAVQQPENVGAFKVCKRDKSILDSDGSFTVSQRTRPEWSGEYFAKIYYWKDRKTKDSVNVYFTVKPKGS
jgi:hypothetical protein